MNNNEYGKIFAEFFWNLSNFLQYSYMYYCFGYLFVIINNKQQVETQTLKQGDV